MSERLAQLRSLAVGVGNLQHGQPGDEDHFTAADVIRWAVAELERHRMTPGERMAVWAGALAIDRCDEEMDGMDSGAGETLRRPWLRTQDINQEVPALSDLSLATHSVANCYRAAMTAAGVKWKEVPRE